MGEGEVREEEGDSNLFFSSFTVCFASNLMELSVIGGGICWMAGSCAEGRVYRKGV